MDKNKCILFITTDSAYSYTATKYLEEIVDFFQEDTFETEIIDVAKRPDSAIEYGIIAIPMLIVIKADSVNRIIGNLSDVERVKYELSKL